MQAELLRELLSEVRSGVRTVESAVERLRKLPFEDIGFARLDHHLLAAQDQLNGANVVVVVAGMDGALPTLVAGLVSAPVIAVPTSIGYGTGLGGTAALMTMLNACAPGIAVVNIDNGFGAGYMAHLINARGSCMAVANGV